MDLNDPLKSFRNEFHIPNRNGKPVIYFCGNSLGLQPKITRKYLEAELLKWEQLAVDGHFSAPSPWIDLHKKLKPGLCQLLGAKVHEVCPMNSLTNNLHFLLASFYSPIGSRTKILTEDGAFPSDEYAVGSHIKFRGFNPENIVIKAGPENGKFTIPNEKIIETIHAKSDEISLVMLSGIQYYSGQFFDLKGITKAAHECGVLIGFDLAHAIGNVPLSLHDWGVDFATWCTYKYLNSGPGAVSGIYIHEKYANDTSMPRLAGWWGQNESRRFLMEPAFNPEPGADGWQQSNQNILSLAAHQAAMEIFERAGMDRLRSKSILLTNYLEYLIRDMPEIEIITPSSPNQRGAQLSLFFIENGKACFDFLVKNGVTGDWREPNVIRVAPTPLYNTFKEVYRFAEILRSFFKRE